MQAGQARPNNHPGEPAMKIHVVLASEARRWLTQLPEHVAHRIALQNAGDLVGIQKPSLRRARPEGG